MGSKGLLKNKYILLAVLLIAVFALPGCRTRITNNSEVSNVYMDEDGFLTETYQMRRDELGLTTAEKPILPDFGGGDTGDDDFDTSEETNFNYAPEEDTYVEPPTTNTTTNTTTTTNPSTSTRTTSRRTTPSRRSSSSSTTSKVTITFDPGSGQFENKKEGEKISEQFEKNGTYTLPKASYVKWEGHNLTGWNASDGSGTKSPGAKLRAKSTVTYTAVWDPPEDENKEYTVTFDANGGSFNISGKKSTSLKRSIKYGETYETILPPNPTLKGSTFDGWYTDKSGGTQVGASTTFKRSKDRTLYAHWKKGSSDKPSNPDSGKKPEPEKPEPEKPEPEKPEPTPTPETTYYKVTFLDGQGNTLSEENVESGKEATAPSEPKRSGYTFDGWDKDFSKVESDLEITAKWTKKGAAEYWSDMLETKVNGDKKNCYLDGISDSDWVKKAGVSPKKLAESDYVIIFTDKYGDDYEMDEKYSQMSVLLVSDEAMTNDETEIAYAIRIMNYLYDGRMSANETDEAFKDLMGGSTPKIKTFNW